MNLKPEPVSGRENFPFSGRHGETSAMQASGAIPMIRFRIPGGKGMNTMHPGTRGKVHFFSETGPSTLSCCSEWSSRANTPLFALLQVNFRKSFLERRAVLFPPPSESAASVGEVRNKKVQRSPSGLKGRGRNLGFLGGSIPGFQGKFQHPVPIERKNASNRFPSSMAGSQNRSSCHMRS